MKNRTSRQEISLREPAQRHARWRVVLLLALSIAVSTALFVGPPSLTRYDRSEHASEKVASSARPPEPSAWHVGMLRGDGLRIVPSGRSDASRVLSPNQFNANDVRHAYWVATQIPAVLNKLYCWCGCENRGIHRSNLQCFEDEMAVTCAVSRGTAEIAWQMTRAGVTDAGKIQAAVDAKWGPTG